MTTHNSKPFCTHHCLPNLHTYKYPCACIDSHIPSLIYHCLTNLHTYKYPCARIDSHIPFLIYHCLTNLHTYKYACAHVEYHIPSLIYQPCRFILHMSTSDVRLEKTNEKHEVNHGLLCKTVSGNHISQSYQPPFCLQTALRLCPAAAARD